MQKQWKGFVAGLVVAAMAFGLGNPAVAALVGKTINVYTGVEIYIDDVKLNPTDANGNPVEVFVYNGTTYLPVRAVGEAVGKIVQWEAKTNSVYLGKHTGETPAAWLVNLEPFQGKAISHTAQTDNMGTSYNQTVCENFDNTYLLNGQYSAISGTFFGTKDFFADGSCTLEIYGDGELLYRSQIKQGVRPIEFNVDITGILELEVDFYFNDHKYGGNSRAGIANFGLWT